MTDHDAVFRAGVLADQVAALAAMIGHGLESDVANCKPMLACEGLAHLAGGLARDLLDLSERMKNATSPAAAD